MICKLLECSSRSQGRLRVCKPTSAIFHHCVSEWTRCQMNCMDNVGRLAGGNVLSSDSASTTPITQIEKLTAPKSKSSGRTIYCFSCNRQEGHFIAAYSRFILILSLILSLGLYAIFGQYRCHCCSSPRMFRYDFLNPKYWYRKIQLRRDGVGRNRRRKSSRSRRSGRRRR